MATPKRQFFLFLRKIPIYIRPFPLKKPECSETTHKTILISKVDNYSNIKAVLAKVMDFRINL